MGKVIPQFSIRNINKIDDYERFYHSKAYLKKKSGYTKFNKFVEHRKE